MNIKWNEVTRFSQAIAIVLFVLVFAFGFWLGTYYQKAQTPPVAAVTTGPNAPENKVVASITYFCDNDKNVRAVYRASSVGLILSDGRNVLLPQALSADGARYANADESFVFWNKGNGAFITEGVGNASKTTFANCLAKPMPE